MVHPTYPLLLTPADHSALRVVVKKGNHRSRKITRANALLLMDAGNRVAAGQARASIRSMRHHRIVNGILSTYPPQGNNARR